MALPPKSVDVGFIEKKENWLLHPRFFPSKVGGKPAWLNLSDLPNPVELECRLCKEPLIFLCQIYAPFEESAESFHRSIYIFICRNGACCRSNNSVNICVLRCQLPRKNEFYSFEPSQEDHDEVFPMEKWAKLCAICSAKAPSHCSKCKKTFYCSRKHQVLDWQKGHKELCTNQQVSYKDCFVPTEAGKTLLFDEWELIVDEEDEEEESDVDVDKEMIKMKKMLEDKKAGTLEAVSEGELEQYVKPLPEDKIFNKFNKRIARHPDQVLRYDRGGSPLWITGHMKNSLLDIPHCPYCNEERQFELQIMPQLLNFINVGIEVNGIDWGVLAVYTCKASCTEGPAYKIEYLVKQDLVSESSS